MSKDLEDNFQFAVDQIRNSESRPAGKGPTDDEKLRFYGLYKQATVGKCNTSRPWAVQFVECAKWDAWNKLGNMSKNEAKEKYCDLYLETSEKYK
jgi:diazepam-binding inhibitor (GABA receptor modulating acyl-CoA-binding protein)